jgi:hypothetical protein
MRAKMPIESPGMAFCPFCSRLSEQQFLSHFSPQVAIRWPLARLGANPSGFEHRGQPRGSTKPRKVKCLKTGEL